MQNTVALIETYRNFPSASSPVDKYLLACSGFKYTGSGDRVVCSWYVVLLTVLGLVTFTSPSSELFGNESKSTKIENREPESK